jgi:hypothetical protein
MKHKGSPSSDDVEKARRADAAAKGKARENAQETKGRREAFARKARIVIDRRDVRAFTELLKHAEISEGTPEWERAWKAFYR